LTSALDLVFQFASGSPSQPSTVQQFLQRDETAALACAAAVLRETSTAEDPLRRDRIPATRRSRGRRPLQGLRQLSLSAGETPDRQVALRGIQSGTGRLEAVSPPSPAQRLPPFIPGPALRADGDGPVLSRLSVRLHWPLCHFHSVRSSFRF